jgi:hypothetical protein
MQMCNLTLCAVHYDATCLRFNLLTEAWNAPDSAVTEPVLNLYCAIASQCFINDYVFAQSDAETAAARALRDKLGAMPHLRLRLAISAL